jgi:anti-anti-sigma factor
VRDTWRIEFTSEGGTRVVALTGDFDLANSDRLQQRLLSLPSSNQPVTLDLTATRFMDSTAIGVLVAAHTQHGVNFIVRGASPGVRRALDILGIDEILPFED